MPFAALLQDSIHLTINRDTLSSLVQDKGFQFRQLAKPSDAPALIASVTDNYLQTTRRQLIQHTLIPRSATQELLAKIRGAIEGTDCVLTGKAGGGKTGCVIECVDGLLEGNDPAVVLAFRLDRIKLVSSTRELGKYLGLEESPALVLATAAEATSSKAVLVIDQLDAVSTTSGRRSDFFELVEDLLIEVRGLRSRAKFHVVVACRAFDWENDHRLRRLLGNEAGQISVTDFSLDEVKDVLTRSGFRTDLFDEKQMELLRLPQNLALFHDIEYDPEVRPTFYLAKDLFDEYWTVKRKAINAGVASSDYWHNVIQMLCHEITALQQLSIPKEKLDAFPNEYVDQMVSEGVLSFDGKRYGFGHESFFDYCFARGFVANEESLAESLTASEQHLFRRSQVRQVLVYLRDADRVRYCTELRTLLKHENVRYHLKDLAVALAVSPPDPEPEEWDVLAPWIESEIDALKSGRDNSDRFASLVWGRFFSSQPWFQIADGKGLVAEWLASDNDRLVDIGVKYVRVHQKHSGDRAAELLEPFVGRDGTWRQRLNYVMQGADLEHSRRFFELFLRLVDDGTLDEARGHAFNSTFWSMLHGLAEARPDWTAEVLAHWLRRRLTIIRETGSDTDQPAWHELFNRDNFGSKPVQEAATRAPKAFTRHVLPVVLDIADEAVYGEEKSVPKRDAVWPIFLRDREYSPVDQACREAITTAAEKLAEAKADSIEGILAALRSRDTYMANFLLLHAYTAGAEYLADNAVSELCDSPWRFNCGYSDSPYWTATQLIKAVAPLCSNDNRARLEQAVLNYSSPYEGTLEGYKVKGRTSFNLLSGIPAELRSPRTQRRYMELERKFGTPAAPPKTTQGYWVGSPIEKSAAEKMTDERWLSAMKKYESEGRKDPWAHPEKGGAFELASVLEESVKREPERFARLSIRFAAGTHHSYVGYTLRGLKDANVCVELKLNVCRKAYDEYRESCGKELADMLGSIGEPLPDDAVRMIHWLATEHPDPESEAWTEHAVGDTPYYGGDILTHGINTVRGRAAGAIRNLIQKDASYIKRFRSTIEALVTDSSAAVRSWAASTILVTFSHESKFALRQFLRLVEPRGDPVSDERLLATRDVEHFVNCGLQQHFGQLRPVVERMLRSSFPETSEAGARLASIAALLGHDDAEALVYQALCGIPSQRLGVAQVASGNVDKAEHRTWSEAKLLLLFNDDDSEVRREAAMCFGHLDGQPMETYESLIRRFCGSAAYQEDSFHLLSALEHSPHRLPGVTMVACEKFLERFGDEARDIRTHRFVDGSTATKLILRTYHQHQHDEWTPKCLDLIDRMCLERTYGLEKALDDYER